MSQSLKFFAINIFTDQRTAHTNSTSLQEQTSSSTLSTCASKTTPRSAIKISLTHLLYKVLLASCVMSQ